MKRFIQRGLKITQSRVLTLRKWNYSHNLLVLFVSKTNTVNVFYWAWKILSPYWKARGLHSRIIETKLPELLLCKSKRVIDSTIKEEIASFIFNDMVNKKFKAMAILSHGDYWKCFVPRRTDLLEMSTKTMQFNVLQTHVLSFIFLVKKDKI